MASALCREQQRGTKGPSCELVVEKPWRHVRRIDGMRRPRLQGEGDVSGAEPDTASSHHEVALHYGVVRSGLDAGDPNGRRPWPGTASSG